ncbi:hypothetical protein TNCT_204361 [Trichonephila clavata]|uniref:Uncharacterized protein n=1 Tax=Trichonephila clavata TaxID=2740835 RepID=A0A8X6HE28_TRICU|nr:hypothetical protein TNCT_204361 [Trichonephila clavata]
MSLSVRDVITESTCTARKLRNPIFSIFHPPSHKRIESADGSGLCLLETPLIKESFSSPQSNHGNPKLRPYVGGCESGDRDARRRLSWKQTACGQRRIDPLNFGQMSDFGRTRVIGMLQRWAMRMISLSLFGDINPVVPPWLGTFFDRFLKRMS